MIEIYFYITSLDVAKLFVVKIGADKRDHFLSAFSAVRYM